MSHSFGLCLVYLMTVSSQVPTDHATQAWSCTMEKKPDASLHQREQYHHVDSDKCSQLLLLPPQPAVKMAKNAIQSRWNQSWKNVRSWSGLLQTSQATCHPTLHLLPSVLLVSLPRGQALTSSSLSHSQLYWEIKADLGMRKREQKIEQEIHNVLERERQSSPHLEHLRHAHVKNLPKASANICCLSWEMVTPG